MSNFTGNHQCDIIINMVTWYIFDEAYYIDIIWILIIASWKFIWHYSKVVLDNWYTIFVTSLLGFINSYLKKIVYTVF